VNADGDPDSLCAVYQLWLILHIVGAIGAFGFGFTAPIFGAALAKEPQHGNWFLRSTKRVSEVLIIPLALSMAVTGTLLVLSTGGFSRFGEAWLAVAVVVYVIALLLVFLVQRPTLQRLIALTSSPPGPDGPPAEVPSLLSRLRLVGILLLVAIVTIVVLMVAKPGR
jgi:uncharacterized membrane protein